MAFFLAPSSLIHAAGNVAAPLAEGLGAITGSGSLSDLGHNISDPNATLTNPGALGTNNGYAFSGTTHYAAQPGGTSKGSSGPTPQVTQNTNGQVLGASTTYSNLGTGSGGTGSGASKVNAADVAAYQDQINSLNNLLTQADASRQNGMNSYNQAYNNGLASLNQSQSNVMQGYNTQQSDATGDYQKTLDQINANARNGYNSLQMLLGGTGSAGTILAPFAVSQQANQQRGGAQDSFAKNLRNIDTAKKQANQDYQNKLNDLLTQKNSGIQKLISDIDAQKQNYLSQIAAAQNQLNVAKGGGYTSPTATQAQIQQLMQEQNNLQQTYANPTLQVNPVTGQAVDLSQYQTQAAQLADNNNNVADNSTDPAAALAALLKQNQDQTSSAYSY